VECLEIMQKVFLIGNKQIFLAPPAHMVPTLMENLFKWMNEAKKKINPLILSSIFHYEFVFIHPFSDGNRKDC